MQRLLSVLAVGLFVASSAFVHAQKTVDLKTGERRKPARSDRMDDRWREYLDRIRPSLSEGAHRSAKKSRRMARSGVPVPTSRPSSRRTSPSSSARSALRPAATRSTRCPPKSSGQLILGRLSKPGQWGIPYQKDLEIGRTPMTLGTTKAPVENVTISIDDTPAGATLRVEWGTASVTAPFTVG